MPFILYVRTTSDDPRQDHLRLAGIVLPADDPFWGVYFPPNGWGCKCAVRQITRRERNRLADRGSYMSDGREISVETEAPDLGPPRIFENKRTGQTVEIPAGIDPGWHTNPGLARARTILDGLTARLEQAGPDVARTAIEDYWRSPAPRIATGLPERLRLPAAVVPERIAEKLGAATQILALATDTIAAKTAKHREVDLDVFATIQDVVDRGIAVDQGRLDKLSLYAVIAGEWWQLVIAKSVTGFLRVQTFHRSSSNKVRRALARRGDDRIE